MSDTPRVPSLIPPLAVWLRGELPDLVRSKPKNAKANIAHDFWTLTPERRVVYLYHKFPHEMRMYGDREILSFIRCAVDAKGRFGMMTGHIETTRKKVMGKHYTVLPRAVATIEAQQLIVRDMFAALSVGQRVGLPDTLWSGAEYFLRYAPVTRWLDTYHAYLASHPDIRQLLPPLRPLPLSEDLTPRVGDATRLPLRYYALRALVADRGGIITVSQSTIDAHVTLTSYALAVLSEDWETRYVRGQHGYNAAHRIEARRYCFAALCCDAGLSRTDLTTFLSEYDDGAGVSPVIRSRVSKAIRLLRTRECEAFIGYYYTRMTPDEMAVVLAKPLTFATCRTLNGADGATKVVEECIAAAHDDMRALYESALASFVRDMSRHGSSDEARARAAEYAARHALKRLAPPIIAAWVRDKRGEIATYRERMEQERQLEKVTGDAPAVRRILMEQAAGMCAEVAFDVYLEVRQNDCKLLVTLRGEEHSALTYEAHETRDAYAWRMLQAVRVLTQVYASIRAESW